MLLLACLPILLVLCSLAPSTLAVQQVSSREVPSTFRAEGSPTAASAGCPALGSDIVRPVAALAVRANVPYGRGGWGNPASHILL